MTSAEAEGQRVWQWHETLQAQEDKRQSVQGQVDRAEEALEVVLAKVTEARAREREREWEREMTEIGSGSNSSTSNNNNVSNNVSKGQEEALRHRRPLSREPAPPSPPPLPPPTEEQIVAMEALDRKHALGTSQHTLS